MEFISEDFKDKPVRHTFDRKVFLRYFGFILIYSAIILLFMILFILFGKVQNVLRYVFRGRASLPVVLFFVGLFYKRIYTFKSNDVFTVPGCVLYRKRKLFSPLFGSVHYVIYCITNVKSMTGWRGFTIVWGDIKAAYVLKDGKTIHSYKKCRRVVIPNCFTDMDVIWKTLEAMKT